MNKDSIIRKLTSRKFWLALAGLITGIVGFLQHPTTDAQTITSLILALGSVVAYLVAEGLVDAASAGQDVYVSDEPYHPVKYFEEQEEKPPEE